MARGLAALDGTGRLDRVAEQQQLSVSVVLPASGCEMIAKVLRRAISPVVSASLTNSDPL